MATLVVCAVVPSAIGTPSGSTLNLRARVGWMIAHTVHTPLFQVTKLSLMAMSLTLEAMNGSFWDPVIVGRDYKVKDTLQLLEHIHILGSFLQRHHPSC